MVKFKEFSSTFTYRAVDMLNEFLEENNIEYIDLKIFDSSHFLLIYKEKEEK